MKNNKKYLERLHKTLSQKRNLVLFQDFNTLEDRTSLLEFIINSMGKTNKVPIVRIHLHPNGDLWTQHYSETRYISDAAEVLDVLIKVFDMEVSEYTVYGHIPFTHPRLIDDPRIENFKMKLILKLL